MRYSILPLGRGTLGQHLPDSPVPGHGLRRQWPPSGPSLPTAGRGLILGQCHSQNLTFPLKRPDGLLCLGLLTGVQQEVLQSHGGPSRGLCRQRGQAFPSIRCPSRPTSVRLPFCKAARICGRRLSASLKKNVIICWSKSRLLKHRFSANSGSKIAAAGGLIGSVGLEVADTTLLVAAAAVARLSTKAIVSWASIGLDR